VQQAMAAIDLPQLFDQLAKFPAYMTARAVVVC
jgi:hypothetical protein